MTSLRDAVRMSLKKRRHEGSPRNKGRKGGKKKFFNVTIEFDVTEKRSIQHLVTAESRDDAIKAAEVAFNDADALHLAQRGNFLYPRRYSIAGATITNISDRLGSSLSQQQREVLSRMYFEGLKLYRRGSHIQSRELKHSENETTTWPNRKIVTVQTIDALCRKGLVIPESKLIRSKDESRVQKALGTLPSERVLVINKEIVKQFGLRLKDPRK